MTNQISYKLQNRAYQAMGSALDELRNYVARPINDQGKKHLFLVADIAHSIHSDLARKDCVAKALERDLDTLESRLLETKSKDDSGFCDHVFDIKPTLLSRVPPWLVALVGVALIAAIGLLADQNPVPSAAIAGLWVGCFVGYQAWGSANKPIYTNIDFLVEAVGTRNQVFRLLEENEILKRDLDLSETYFKNYKELMVDMCRGDCSDEKIERTK